MMTAFKKISLYVVAFLMVAEVVNAQAPTITSFSPNNGAVGTLVTITGTNLASPSVFSIGGKNAVVISNTGTKLVGMVMPGSVNGVVSISTPNGSIVSTDSIRIARTMSPIMQSGEKLVGTGSIGKPEQGYSVAMSADGRTAVVGGSGDNNRYGAVWIYVFNGNQWVQQGDKLVGTGGVDLGHGPAVHQGISVAISADGNTVLAGGHGDTDNQGACWVFTRSGTTWSQQGNKLVGTGNTQAAYQGISVAISADGNTAIVGGSNDGANLANGNVVGAAWIFTRSGTTWSQQGNKLVGTGSIGDTQQGISVAISADGNTAAIGGFVDNNGIGAVWIFTRNGNSWTQQGNKLTPTGNIGSASIGQSVALSADGDILASGGIYDNGGIGAVWVFTRTNNIWIQQGNKLVGTGNIGNSQQGFSVALSADGNTIISGGPFDDSRKGAVWVFEKNGSSWSQVSKLVGNNIVSNQSLQGISTSLSADGFYAIVGGSLDNSGFGAAWIFANAITLPLELLTFNAQPQSSNVALAWQTANEVNTSHFTIQHSVDGTKFYSIGKVAAKGDGSYSYVDNQLPIASVVYYRLQIVDKDGSFTFSKMVAVTLVDNRKTLVLYPNPVKDNLSVQFTSTKAEKITLQVTDLQGRLLQQEDTQVGVGSLSLSVNTSALAKGSYLLLVKGSTGLQQKQFVKE